ncbi:MAG TPA: hypothetical protein VM782_15125 [Stellaceae bacterium]|nr:hypothetical protein [Stellaceae bacterium]
MISASLRERAVLDELEPAWRRRGYTLIREPSKDQLPPFLKGFRPDAIAVGASPCLVIEVVRGQGGAAETKIRQLHDLIEGHEDWQLEVVYSSQDGVRLAAVARADIRNALQTVRAIADSEPRAGLLLVWATLEAIGRSIEPELASRSLAPRSLVDLLVSKGHIDQDDGLTLRRMADLRNALAHGQIDKSPSPAEVDFVADISEKLMSD